MVPVQFALNTLLSGLAEAVTEVLVGRKPKQGAGQGLQIPARRQ